MDHAIIERNILSNSREARHWLLIELMVVRNSRKPSIYELNLTNEALKERNEPNDSIDFREYESDDSDDERGADLPKRKKFYAVVGPDLSCLD